MKDPVDSYGEWARWQGPGGLRLTQWQWRESVGATPCCRVWLSDGRTLTLHDSNTERLNASIGDILVGFGLAVTLRIHAEPA